MRRLERSSQKGHLDVMGSLDLWAGQAVILKPMADATSFELGRLFDIRPGPDLRRALGREPYRVLQVANLGLDGVDLSGEAKIEHLHPQAATPHVPRPGSLIVSLRSLELPVAVVEEELKGHVLSSNLTLMVLEPEFKDRVRPGFVAALLRSRAMRDRLAPLFRGVAARTLSAAAFRRVTVGLPPLEVQDALVEARQAIRRQEIAFQRLTELRLVEWDRHAEQHVAPARRNSTSGRRS